MYFIDALTDAWLEEKYTKAHSGYCRKVEGCNFSLYSPIYYNLFLWWPCIAHLSDSALDEEVLSLKSIWGLKVTYQEATAAIQEAQHRPKTLSPKFWIYKYPKLKAYFFFSFVLFCFCFCCWDRVSLYGPCCPGICYVGWPWTHGDLSASGSWV